MGIEDTEESLALAETPYLGLPLLSNMRGTRRHVGSPQGTLGHPSIKSRTAWTGLAAPEVRGAVLRAQGEELLTGGK